MTSNPLQAIGHGVLALFAAIGRLSLFAMEATSHCARPPFYPRLVVRQMVEIGFYSLPVVGLTGLFAGMVLALQSYTGFSRFSAESTIPTVVVLSITRELGPVLAGLMVAGRVGAAMAAEIGTMRVTEQIDALTTLSTNPHKYLIVPRLIGGFLMLPFLVLVTDIIGVGGGYLVSVFKLGFNPDAYINNTLEYLEVMGRVSGLVKAAVFGYLIAPDGLLPRLLLQGRRPGSGQGHHQRGRDRRDPGADLQLHHHRGVLRPMSAPASERAGGGANQPKIALRGVCRRSRARSCSTALDLEIGTGESVVVIGCSGVGKSVMLKCLLGLLHPDAGSVTIDGAELAHDRTAREAAMRKIGMLFQTAPSSSSLPVWENVAFGLIQAHGMARREARGIAIETLAQVGLGEDSADLYPAALSGGMRKRVGLARGHRDPARDHPLRRADDRARPHPGRRHQRPHRRPHPRPRRDRAHHHPRHPERAQDRDRIAMIHEGAIIWQGPAGEIDSSGNAHVNQFINGRAEGRSGFRPPMPRTAEPPAG